jgi:hypothetical protein
MKYSKVAATISFPGLIAVDGDFFASRLMDLKCHISEFRSQKVINEKLSAIIKVDDPGFLRGGMLLKRTDHSNQQHKRSEQSPGDR